jgi:hypothetical protein
MSRYDKLSLSSPIIALESPLDLFHHEVIDLMAEPPADRALSVVGIVISMFLSLGS